MVAVHLLEFLPNDFGVVARRRGHTGLMHAHWHGVNAINIGDKALLLTDTSGGTAVHLTAESAVAGSGQGAVPEHYFKESASGTSALRHNYDKAALVDRRWSDKTLCGRQWVSMASGEGGLLHEFDREVVFAPTCKRCLALMDKLFPAPTPDDRLALVVRVVTDLVLEHGYAEIQSVPGDQQAALRAQVRTAVRERSGHGTKTHVHQSMIIFVCDEIYDQHADEHDRHAAEAIDRVLEAATTGSEIVPTRQPEWRTSWDAWSVV